MNENTIIMTILHKNTDRELYISQKGKMINVLNKKEMEQKQEKRENLIRILSPIVGFIIFCLLFSLFAGILIVINLI